MVLNHILERKVWKINRKGLDSMKKKVQAAVLGTMCFILTIGLFVQIKTIDNYVSDGTILTKEKAMKIVLSTRYNFRNTQFKNQVKKDIKNNIKPLLKTFVSDKRIAFKNKFGLLFFYYLPSIRFRDQPSC